MTTHYLPNTTKEKAALFTWRHRQRPNAAGAAMVALAAVVVTCWGWALLEIALWLWGLK